MIDPRELLDTYAGAAPSITALEPREAAAPQAFAALRAVLDLHQSAPCGCLHHQPSVPNYFCGHDGQDWPCETVRAVTAPLQPDVSGQEGDKP